MAAKPHTIKNHVKALATVKASEAFELYKKGLTHVEIAKQIGVSESTVSLYIRNTLKALSKANSTDMAIVRAEIKERLLYIAAESVKAWEQSKEFSSKKITKSKKTGKNYGNENTEQTEVGHGDVKFLELAKDTVDSLTKLFGAAPTADTPAPGTISISSNGGTGEVTIKTTWGVTPIKDADVVDVTPEVKEIEYAEDTSEEECDQPT